MLYFDPCHIYFLEELEKALSQLPEIQKSQLTISNGNAFLKRLGVIVTEKLKETIFLYEKYHEYSQFNQDMFQNSQQNFEIVLTNLKNQKLKLQQNGRSG